MFAFKITVGYVITVCPDGVTLLVARISTGWLKDLELDMAQTHDWTKPVKASVL